MFIGPLYDSYRTPAGLYRAVCRGAGPHRHLVTYSQFPHQRGRARACCPQWGDAASGARLTRNPRISSMAQTAQRRRGLGRMCPARKATCTAGSPGSLGSPFRLRSCRGMYQQHPAASVVSVQGMFGATSQAEQDKRQCPNTHRWGHWQHELRRLDRQHEKR